MLQNAVEMSEYFNRNVDYTNVDYDNSYIEIESRYF